MQIKYSLCARYLGGVPLHMVYYVTFSIFCIEATWVTEWKGSIDCYSEKTTGLLGRWSADIGGRRRPGKCQKTQGH